MAFTDLVAASVGLLPGCAPFADRDEMARVTAAARSSPDFHRWPGPCVALLEACEAVIDKDNPMTALRNGEIGRATSCEWPPVELPLWQRRRDVGDLWGDAA